MDFAELREIARIARNESDDLAGYLDTLSEDQWGMPSACTGWSVADVVGHLLFVYKDRCFDWVSRGLLGDTSAPEGFPFLGNISMSDRDKHIFDDAKRYSSEYGSDLLPAFKSYVRKVDQLWGTLNPDDLDMPMYGRLGIQPIASSTIRIPITETAMHHWDIRSRLHPETASLSSDSATYLMESARSFRFFEPGAKLASPERYRVVLDGYQEPGLDFVVEGDKAYVERLGQSKPEVTFKCDAETLVLIMYGRLELEEAEHEKRISYEGDKSSALRFVGWLSNT